jgi:hypothetical protein
MVRLLSFAICFCCAWQGTVRTLAVAGGTGGFPATRDCPRNFAVSGFSGRGSAFVNRLRLECRRLVSPTALRRNGAPRQTAFVGGRGGEAFAPFHCPDDLRVTGLQGHFPAADYGLRQRGN